MHAERLRLIDSHRASNPHDYKLTPIGCGYVDGREGFERMNPFPYSSPAWYDYERGYQRGAADRPRAAREFFGLLGAITAVAVLALLLA